MAGDDGGTKPSSGHDDTLPADALDRPSLPRVPPPPDARYQLGKELGRGGMGRVVEAFDTHLGRTVALKEVLPQARNIDRRFQREVRITARLEHASIIPLYDSGRLADGRPFYVMRRVTGRPLDEMIARAGSLDRRLALLPNVLAAIDAVAHAHSRGVIHRDLKPQNILVGDLGETVVIDWGLAKVIGDEEGPPDSLEPRIPSAADSMQTQVGSVFGTPGFMAPEQARGDELGPPGDVYALGATLYQLLVGKPPFGGTSATEVISKTLRNRLEPIATAAPGAPAELATIIEKALAYEPEHRYPNAGELAEDVRRFLTGQLVGAHHYTPRQRLARFARRHRAALSVAALASVGIAVLAWVGVHRIVHERDVAEQASEEARTQRERADARAAELRERADQLLLAHARGLVNDNPTQALAVLKQVAASASSADAIKAIARGAVLRGIPWGLPPLPDLTTGLELSPDGRRVVQIDRGGAMQVVDLDQRRAISKRQLVRGAGAHWVDQGRRLALMMPGAPLTLYDPVAGTEEKLATDEIDSLAVSDNGERLAAVTTKGQAFAIDVPERRVTPIPGVTDVERIDISDDGAWFVVSQRAAKSGRVLVVDASGKVLASHDGQPMAITAGASRVAAAFWKEAIYELDLKAAHPTFTKLAIDPRDLTLVPFVFYRGDVLHALTAFALLRWTGKGFERLQEFSPGPMYGAPIADNTLVAGSNDGLVYVIRESVSHVLRVPTYTAGMVRVATTPASPRIVVAAREALLVWDASTFMPRVLPSVIDGVFANETTIVSSIDATSWQALDLTTGTMRKEDLDGFPGLPGSVDLEGGRLLMTMMNTPNSSRGTIVTIAGRVTKIPHIAWNLARLVAGDAVVYSPGKGRVLGAVGTEEPRELVSLDSDVASLAGVGTLEFAALSEHGELVRGHFDGSGFRRTVVSGVDEHSFIAGEVGGTVLIAVGRRVLRWDGVTTTELTHVDGEIERVHSSDTGLLITLTDHSALYLRMGESKPQPITIPQRSMVAASGTRLAGVGGAGQLEMMELPSRAAWTVPHMMSTPYSPVLSPSGRSLYQTIGDTAALWTIPEPASDLAAWLDEMTNATEVDERVHWPWERDP